MDTELQMCLENCDLSTAQVQALALEGYLMLDDFANNRYQDISEMAKRVQALPPDRGGVRFGQGHIHKLKAFLWWLKDRVHRGLALDLDDGGFGEEQLATSMQEYLADEEWKDTDDATSHVPDKFSPHSLRGWNNFNTQLKNYLSSIRGLSGIPLVYVIHNIRGYDYVRFK